MARARFVARYGAFSVGIQDEIREFYATGKSKVLQRRIDANFQNRLVTDEDFAVALATFTFPGLPEDFDTNTLVSPRYRVSVWDSEIAKRDEGFTDEEIELIISKLREDPSYGYDFVEVDVPKKKAPFPTYDDLEDIEQIVAIVKGAGLSIDEVVEYEKENRNREDLIKALLGVDVDENAIVVKAG